MRIIIFSAVLLITFLFVRATAMNHHANDEEKGIKFFEGTWTEALALAKKENKLIFLDAYASWCGPCKLMKRRVFSSTKAGEFFNANFINVEMDMEKGEGPALAKMYKVTAYPSLFFVDHTSKIKKRSAGYHNVGQLIHLGNEALK